MCQGKYDFKNSNFTGKENTRDIFLQKWIKFFQELLFCELFYLFIQL